jgi:Ca2+-transporting ATPase
MGYEHKKRNLTAIPIISSVGSSSAYYRPQPPTTTSGNATTSGPPTNPRTASPPASTYFPLISADANDRFRPTADAESHFAYSTTLRRHHSDGAALTSPHHFAVAFEAEATSLWKRAILTITGQPDRDAGLEDGLPTTASVPTRPQQTPRPVGGLQKEENKDTISSRFAHYSVEVRPCVSLYRFPKMTLK